MPGAIRKYPRTPHIEGSRSQPGDEELDTVPFARIGGRNVSVEEKLDGANCGISFSSTGQLQLQSRGRFLRGGNRERQFNLFKQWANVHIASLQPCLTDRYLLYGEWLYPKHTIFYNHLPHYFVAFDVLDIHNEQFLARRRRDELLGDVPIVTAPLLFRGSLRKLKDLLELVGESSYVRPNRREDLAKVCESLGVDWEIILRETNLDDRMEGLYIKLEEDGEVIERYKYVAPGFLTGVRESDTYWLSRTIVPNQLAPGVDIFSGD